MIQQLRPDLPKVQIDDKGNLQAIVNPKSVTKSRKYASDAQTLAMMRSGQHEELAPWATWAKRDGQFYEVAKVPVAFMNANELAELSKVVYSSGPNQGKTVGQVQKA